MPFAPEVVRPKVSLWFYVIYISIMLMAAIFEQGYSIMAGLCCPLILDLLVRNILFPARGVQQSAIFYRLCCAEACKWGLFAFMLYVLIHIVDGFGLILGLIVGQLILILNNFIWLKY
ncbi:MAG: hypothetical protein CMF42_00250 [Legionellales bacterium]|nr:hypothetical protein [Legionellales bacterium]